MAGDYLERPPDDEARQMLEWLHEEAQAAGRQSETLAVQGVISIGRVPETEWATRAEAWRQFGATDLLIDTGVSGRTRDQALATVDQQIQALRRISQTLEPVLRS